MDTISVIKTQDEISDITNLLRFLGIPVTVHNHSESGRRLIGRTHFEDGVSIKQFPGY